jgi:hypothetical protein
MQQFNCLQLCYQDDFGKACGTYRGQDKFKVLWLKNPEGKKLFVRTRHRWEDNIKMEFREIGWIGVKDCLFPYRNNIN